MYTNSCFQIYLFFDKNITGTILMNTGNFKEASDYLNLISEVYPNDAQVKHDIGYCLMNLKHYKTAIKSIDMAIELDPLRDKFYNTKGNFILFSI